MNTFFINFWISPFKKSLNSWACFFLIKSLTEIKLNWTKYCWAMTTDMIFKSRHEFRIFLSFSKFSFLLCFFIVLLCNFLFDFGFSFTSFLLCLSIAFLPFRLRFLSCLLCFFFKICFKNFFFLLDFFHILRNVVSWFYLKLSHFFNEIREFFFKERKVKSFVKPVSIDFVYSSTKQYFLRLFLISFSLILFLFLSNSRFFFSFRIFNPYILYFVFKCLFNQRLIKRLICFLIKYPVKCSIIFIFRMRISEPASNKK